jgi:group I intron endonuclease
MEGVFMASGIYKITAPSGNFYVGSSCDIKRRWADHRRMLSGNYHHCNPLQSASLKYGLSNLTFEILEECHPDMVLERELHYISALNPKYNLARLPGQTTRGLRHTLEAKAKMSEARSGAGHHNFGKKLSASTKDKMRQSRLGKKHSPETIKKIGASNKRANLGRKLSEETISKMKAAKKRFSDVDYARLRDLHAGGMTQVELAALYGMAQSSIGRHLKLAKKAVDIADQ